MSFFKFFKNSDSDRFCTYTKLELNDEVNNLLNNKFISIDVETTGLDKFNDRIVEISAVIFKDNKPVDSFSSLIKSDVPISEAAVKVNQITNKMLEDSPKEDDVINTFFDFLKNNECENEVFVAHNADFDVGFIINAFNRNKKYWKFNYIDTLSLSRKYIKGCKNYKLDTLVDFLDISVNSKHRAYDDALACGILMNTILENNQKSNIKKNIDNYKTPKIEEDELAVCAQICILLFKHDRPAELITFRKQSSNYVDILLPWSIGKFKISNKGSYFLIDRDFAIDNNMSYKQSTASEGCNLVRYYYNDLNDIKNLCNYFVLKFDEAFKHGVENLDNRNSNFESFTNIVDGGFSLTKEKAKEILNSDVSI